MTTHTDLTATELVAEIVDIFAEIRSVDGIPKATQQMCDHSLTSIHQSLHGLTLWLAELLEWAPLSPETRARVVRLSGVLADANAGFYPTLDHH